MIGKKIVNVIGLCQERPPNPVRFWMIPLKGKVEHPDWLSDKPIYDTWNKWRGAVIIECGNEKFPRNYAIYRKDQFHKTFDIVAYGD